MASYILRHVDEELFQNAKDRARNEGWPLKAVIEQLLRVWVDSQPNSVTRHLDKALPDIRTKV